MKWRAGVAKANITPPVGSTLSGYPNRTEPSIGVKDDLFAKALVLNDGRTRLALVTLDLLGIPGELVAQSRVLIHAATGIAPDHVLLGASHTHAAPPTLPRFIEDKVDEHYLGELPKKIAGAVFVAAQVSVPVTLRLGWSEADISIHRRVVTEQGTLMRPNPQGPVDRRVGVLRLDAEDGSVLAVLVHYACHPNVFRHENLFISADYVGVTSNLVECVYPGSLALFLQGCTGDLRPNLVGEDGEFRSGDDADCQHLGRLLGAAAVKAAEVSLPLPEGGLGAARKCLVFPFIRSVPGQTGVDAEIQALNIGPLIVVTIPGEPFVEIGQRIRQMVGDPVLVAGYANGYLGYLPTAHSHTEGGYEVAQSYRHFGYPGPFVPELEDMIVSAATDLAAVLRQ